MSWCTNSLQYILIAAASYTNPTPGVINRGACVRSQACRGRLPANNKLSNNIIIKVVAHNENEWWYQVHYTWYTINSCHRISVHVLIIYTYLSCVPQVRTYIFIESSTFAPRVRTELFQTARTNRQQLQYAGVSFSEQYITSKYY